MKWALLIVFGLLAHFTLSNADKCAGNEDVNEKPKETKLARLHHIIEFGKRSKVEVKSKDCVGKNSAKTTPKTSSSTLGVHGLLHTQSKQKDKQNENDEKRKTNSLKNMTVEKPKNELGSKRTRDELHKLQLKEETIGMLHKIVEKYFPGGHLTVDQKIKALKILGKLIKLKKEGRNTDIKKMLGALSVHSENGESRSSPNDGKQKEIGEKDEKDEGKSDSDKKDDSGSSNSEDMYANIANGPDVPKLPPAVSGKDPEHAHSNIMPVGVHPVGGASEPMNTMANPNGIGDDLSDRISSYRTPASNTGDGMGYGQIYQTDNNFLGNSMSSLPNTFDSQGYVRSRMPYPGARYRGRGWPRRRYYDDDDDDDDDDEEDDDSEEDDDDGEEARTRSNVNRHRFYNDDDDDDDADDEEEMVYTRRFERKNKIAKTPKKSKKHHLKKNKKH